MRLSQAILYGSATLLMAACTTVGTSNPSRTATEQLLISTAAERAADRLSVTVAPNAKIFIDSTNFDGTDSKYAIGAIRTAMLEKGAHLVDDRKAADVVVETRSGALSTDHRDFLIGIPSLPIPIPLTSASLTIPEIAIYDNDQQIGVAKFAATAYDVKKGTLVSAQKPQFGFSHNDKKTVLLFFSWTNADMLPDDVSEEDDTQAATYHDITTPPQELSLSGPTDKPASPQIPVTY